MVEHTSTLYDVYDSRGVSLLIISAYSPCVVLDDQFWVIYVARTRRSHTRRASKCLGDLYSTVGWCSYGLTLDRILFASVTVPPNYQVLVRSQALRSMVLHS